MGFFFIKSEYPNILENKFETYCGEDAVYWFLDKNDYYSKVYNDTFKTKIPLKEETVTQFASGCYYCKFETEPCYTYTTLSVTWICGLKYTGFRLKYYKEETVNIFYTIQQSKRGELASILGYCQVKCDYEPKEIPIKVVKRII